MYEDFANVYDRMMEEIPYDVWFSNIKKYMEKKGIRSGTVCELGCGTGIMTERFAKAGFSMIGVDISADMLALAQQKKENEKQDILYLLQDMAALELAEPVDVMISVCDSMNYLMEYKTIETTFSQVKKYLKPGGFFIFDVKTRYCYETIMGNRTWTDMNSDICYIWENYFYEDEWINEYSVTIFKKEQHSGLYKRIEENQCQRAYPLEVWKRALEKNNLHVIDCLDEHFKQKPIEKSERIYIVAQA